ncbi:MAG: sulfatase-like hydrolase/transferase [Pirellulales bacterium]
MHPATIRRAIAGILTVTSGLFLSPQRISSTFAAPPTTPPNLVVILADDLGLADLSATGSADLQTPAIDRLFREGARFDNFYANSCVCSPTRAALLSGCYPDRVGVPGVIRDVAADSWGNLDDEARLLPLLLRSAGYHSALVGKWHLGYESPDTPLDRGFDFFHGFLGDMMDDYWTHLRHGHNFLRRDRQPIESAGHATDLFTDWACEYLRTRTAMQQPFFLYLAYNAPHDPLQPPPEFLERVRQRDPACPLPRAKLSALIEHLDAGIDRVLSTLDATGLAKQTLVVFTSDNGGVLEYQARNGPWRSGKQHLYEGGLRVPCAVRWPGQTTAGQHISAVATSMDLFPTLLAAAQAPLPEGIDGVSLLELLRGQQTTLAPRDLYFVRREGGPAYGGKTIEALRRDRWKLLQDSPFAPLELYDLERDPQETTNLAAREPAKVRELATALRAHIQRGGAVPWQPRRPSSP